MKLSSVTLSAPAALNFAAAHVDRALAGRRPGRPPADAVAEFVKSASSGVSPKARPASFCCASSPAPQSSAAARIPTARFDCALRILGSIYDECGGVGQSIAAGAAYNLTGLP